jgi:hypothetical protein
MDGRATQPCSTSASWSWRWSGAWGSRLRGSCSSRGEVALEVARREEVMTFLIWTCYLCLFFSTDVAVGWLGTSEFEGDMLLCLRGAPLLWHRSVNCFWRLLWFIHASCVPVLIRSFWLIVVSGMHPVYNVSCLWIVLDELSSSIWTCIKKYSQFGSRIWTNTAWNIGCLCLRHKFYSMQL